MKIGAMILVSRIFLVFFLYIAVYCLIVKYSVLPAGTTSSAVTAVIATALGEFFFRVFKLRSELK